MSGVTEITADNLTNGCDSLEVLVINGSLEIGNGVFFSATASGVTDAYLTSANDITYSASDNSLLSGNFYVYNANKPDCVKSWWYDESGNIAKSEGTENHSFGNGVCSKCGLTLNTQTLSGTYALDLTNSNETLKGVTLEGDVKNIVVDGKTFAATYDGTKQTVKASVSGVASGNTYTANVITSTIFYTLTVKTWDKVISNATELQSLLDIFNAVTTEPNSANYTKGYFCLDADIDAASVTSTKNKAVFVGTLDGQGHIISNLTTNEGIFYATTMTGKICNIAFKNATATRCFIMYRNGGTLNNVYAEVSVTAQTSWYGVVGQVRLYNNSDKNTINVSNCVFNVTFEKYTNSKGQEEYGNGAGGVLGAWYNKEPAGTIGNLYLINNTNTHFISDNNGNQQDLSAMTTIKTYTSQTTFVGSSDVTFSADAGWATYWKVQDGKLLFGNTQLI